MTTSNGQTANGSTAASSKTTNTQARTRAAKRAANGAATGSGNAGALSPAARMPAVAPVILGDAYLAINQLAVYGAPVDAARECVERGEDLEVSVRRMLDIGASLVQHGGNQATLAS